MISYQSFIDWGFFTDEVSANIRDDRLLVFLQRNTNTLEPMINVWYYNIYCLSIIVNGHSFCCVADIRLVYIDFRAGRSTVCQYTVLIAWSQSVLIMTDARDWIDPLGSRSFWSVRLKFEPFAFSSGLTRLRWIAVAFHKAVEQNNKTHK